ncbi:MAG: hypothetical protein ACLQLG_05510 [Thermoguttaceae bacterium]
MAPEFTPAPAGPHPKLRWYQYRLRSLFLLMLLAAIPLGWLAAKMKAAREQHAAVEAIVNDGGLVMYDYQKDSSDTTSKPPGPAWLRGLFGDDLFIHVTRVYVLWSPEITDTWLEHLKGLTQLQVLDLSGTQVTDAGLEHLKGLTHLKMLSTAGAKVTDAGVKELEEAMPSMRRNPGRTGVVF